MYLVTWTRGAQAERVVSSTSPTLTFSMFNHAEKILLPTFLQVMNVLKVNSNYYALYNQTDRYVLELDGVNSLDVMTQQI